EVQSFGPFALAQQGKAQEAIAGYAALFERGFRSDQDLATFAELLVDSGREQDAFARVRAYLAQGETPGARRALASIHRQRGELVEAIRELDAARRHAPHDRD